jgi:PA domain
LFGSPPYGGSILQRLYYYDGDTCQNLDNTTGYPTRPVDGATGKQHAWVSPFILLVDRGDCTFVQKVRHGQHAGAAAVLIADNTCLCDHDACIDSGDDTCTMIESTLGDDGSGSDITIPTFLLYKEDADAIKAVVKDQNIPVRAEMAFPLPPSDQRVEYKFWSTPADPTGRQFTTQWKEAAVALGDKAFFTPHFYILDGMLAGCDQKGVNECGNMCTNDGRYCALDPDENVNSGISGADVVKESARQICIWSLYGADNGIGGEWCG